MVPDYSQVSLQDSPDNNWKLTLTSADLLSDQPKLAPPVRFERTTTELTARCSTIELQRNILYIIICNIKKQAIFFLVTGKISNPADLPA